MSFRKTIRRFQVLVLGAFCTAGTVAAQGVIIYEQDTTLTGGQDRYDKIDYEIQVGAWVPVGALAERFANGATFGLRTGLPVTPRWRADAGINFNLPSQAENFTYVLPDTSYEISGVRAHIFEINVRASYRAFYNRDWDVELYGGAGFAVLSSTQPLIEVRDPSKYWYRIGTVQLSTGAVVHRRVFGNKTMGLFADYTYAPFALSGRFANGFGNSYLRAGLTMRIVKSGEQSYGPDANGWFVLENEG